MRVIISSKLWLGNAFDLRDLLRIHGTGIQAIVDLAHEERIPDLSRDLTYCRIPILDGAGNDRSKLKLAIGTVVALIDGDIPTIVACSAGMSRSPCIVAAALSVVHGQTPDEVLAELASCGPSDISPQLWAHAKCHAIEMRISRNSD